MMANSQHDDVLLESLMSFLISLGHSDKLDDMSDQAIASARDAAPRTQSHSGKDHNAAEIDLDIGDLTDAELARRLAVARARIESSFFNSLRFA